MQRRRSTSPSSSSGTRGGRPSRAVVHSSSETQKQMARHLRLATLGTGFSQSERRITRILRTELFSRRIWKEIRWKISQRGLSLSVYCQLFPLCSQSWRRRARCAREPGVHGGAVRCQDLRHHGGPAGAAAAEIFSKWWRNFVPLKFLWHLGFCFSSFLLHPPFESEGEPLPTLLEALWRATPKAPPSRDMLSPRCATAWWSLSHGVGRASSFKQLFYFFIVFNFNHSAHIQGKCLWKQNPWSVYLGLW